jgi:hypothetical protein
MLFDTYSKYIQVLGITLVTGRKHLDASQEFMLHSNIGATGVKPVWIRNSTYTINKDGI